MEASPSALQIARINDAGDAEPNEILHLLERAAERASPSDEPADSDDFKTENNDFHDDAQFTDDSEFEVDGEMWRSYLDDASGMPYYMNSATGS